MILDFKLIYKDKEYCTSFIDGTGITENISFMVPEKTFIFISKEDYNNFSKPLSDEIDEDSFEKLSQENEISIQDILDKQIVYVKYNQKEDIQTILDYRAKFTDESAYAFLTLEVKELKYK